MSWAEQRKLPIWEAIRNQPYEEVLVTGGRFVCFALEAWLPHFDFGGERKFQDTARPRRHERLASSYRAREWNVSCPSHVSVRNRTVLTPRPIGY